MQLPFLLPFLTDLPHLECLNSYYCTRYSPRLQLFGSSSCCGLKHLQRRKPGRMQSSLARVSLLSDKVDLCSAAHCLKIITPCISPFYSYLLHKSTMVTVLWLKMEILNIFYFYPAKENLRYLVCYTYLKAILLRKVHSTLS